MHDKKRKLPKNELLSILRVNEAGESGAVRIYEGQRLILGHTQDGPLLDHMLAQEQEHRTRFRQLSQKYGAPRTVFSPLWHWAGFGLGVASALLGRKAAMACTVAVEDVIDQHYQEQMARLKYVEGVDDLRQTVIECHADELEHRDVALERQAREMRGYHIFTTVVKTASRLAIFLSKRR